MNDYIQKLNVAIGFIQDAQKSIDRCHIGISLITAERDNLIAENKELKDCLGECLATLKVSIQVKNQYSDQILGLQLGRKIEEPVYQ